MGAQGKGLGLRAPPAPPSLLCGSPCAVALTSGPCGGTWLLNPEPPECRPAGAVRVSSPPSAGPGRIARAAGAGGRPVCEFLAQQLLLRAAGASGVARRARFSMSTGNGGVVSEHTQGGHRGIPMGAHAHTWTRMHTPPARNAPRRRLSTPGLDSRHHGLFPHFQEEHGF